MRGDSTTAASKVLLFYDNVLPGALSIRGIDEKYFIIRQDRSINEREGHT